MFLAVDIGNTNMEFGLFDQQKLIFNFRLITNHDMTSDEIGIFMSQFFQIHHIDQNKIQHIAIASVVPQVMFSIHNAMMKYIGKKPIIVGETIPIPIENLYQNPKEVGADRLVNAYAAFRHYGGPAIIVDFGTATTFDVINEKGCYIGGCIFPGIKISMEALNRHAAKLPRVEISSSHSAIGTNTIESMQAGAVYGFVGATSYTIAAIQKELQCNAKVIATGGLSGLIAAHSDTIEIVDKTLTLQGLYDIYVNHIESSAEPLSF